MNLLLTAVNAKYIHSNLAVHSLRRFADKYREQIQILETSINQRPEELLREIYLRKPDVLCFSCYIWNISMIRRVAKEIHKICPQLPIWAGGPEVSYDSVEFLKENPAFTGVMYGEGEETFLELCGHYAKEGQDLSAIKGVTFCRADGSITQNVPREPMDLSSIPFPYETLSDFENRIIYYESSRGCPFACSYCLSSIEKKLRFRNTKLVEKELAFLIEQKVQQVKFVDRTFNCSHDHAMQIWRTIQRLDQGITNFHFEISADLLTEEETVFLSQLRPGLIQLEVGVQSTNPQTIQEIQRTMDLDLVQNRVDAIAKGENIHQHLDLIAGLPYEDFQRFGVSFNDIYRWKPNQLQLGFLKVLKGSYMAEHQQEYELVCQSEPPYEILKNRWLSYGEVLQIKLVEEMLEIHYNSGQYEITMKLLEAVQPDAFGFFLRFGEFYQERGYLGLSHSRIRRCEILLEFLEQDAQIREQMEKLLRGAEGSALWKEALTYDLYYRENCKSRPSFAGTPVMNKQWYRQICSRGRLQHVEEFHYHFPGKSTKTISELPQRTKEPVYILFDYEQRDPLDHQALTREIQIQEEIYGKTND